MVGNGENNFKIIRLLAEVAGRGNREFVNSDGN
jgi:hypothetical protein